MKTHNNFDLTQYNSYRVQAKAERVSFPENLDDLRQIFSDLDRPVVILGGGCNVILSRPDYSGIDFVILDHHFSAVNIKKEMVTAQAGVCLKNLSE